MHYDTLFKKLINLTNRNISKADLARILQITPQALNGRLKRNVEFSLNELKKIETALNIDLISETMKSEVFENKINKEVLKNIIEIVEEYLDENNLELIPNKKAELISVIYDLYTNGALNNLERNNVIQFCKLSA